MLTTIYIHKQTLIRLKKIAKRLQIGENHVVCRLLEKYICRMIAKHKCGSTIRYQSRDVKEHWETYRLCFTETEHEYFYGARYFLKVSVSCMLALAAEMYENADLSEEVVVKKNSYFVKSIKMVLFEHEKRFLWKIEWNYP